MKRHRLLRRAFAVMIPACIIILTVAVSGVQDSPSDLFDQVYEIYEYVKSYYYQPEDIDDQQALYGAMRGIVEQLNDPYSEFFTPEEKQAFDDSINGEFSGVGIEITLEEGVLTVITPLVGSPAEAAGMRAGDRIFAIDSESTEGDTLTQSALKIRGDIGSTVVLSVFHEDGTTEDIAIVRETIVIEAVRYEPMEDGTIAYIRLLRFEDDTTRELDEALLTFDLANITGLILDLRNNAGGLMSEALSVVNHFVDDGVILITQDRLSGQKKYYARGNQIRNFPIAILINRGTASSSEIAAGAIRDNNMAILIGEQSFGKGVYQNLIDLLDGSALKITAGSYFTPNGTAVHGVGLPPDIVLEEDQDAIEVAIQWINDHAGIEMPIDIAASVAP
ncbi:S41 family peptidase [Candidatus Bipolaricaulota bacterium]|nr:S41 family peptidase [Candidatus Bipolaricaulota bacterium]